MAALMPQGKQQYFTAGGIPLVGGKVYTYAAGTTTPLATYTTAAAGTPNANPVILDSRGEASIFFSAANYKVVLKDSLDSTIWTQDNLPGDAAATILANLAASTGSSLVGHIASGTGAVATTVQAKLRERISVLDFGPNTIPGTTDMTAVFQSALDYANSLSGATVFVPPGTYKITATLNIYKDTILEGSNQGVSILATTQAGDGIASTWPINSSTQVNIKIKDLWITNNNASNVGGGFADVGGSMVALEHVYIQGFQYSVILDQSELADLERCIFLLPLESAVWIVNGPDHTPGAATLYTNRITVSRCQISNNAVTTGIAIVDDGGVAHSFENNNYQGFAAHIRSVNNQGLAIRGGEFEFSSSTSIIFETTRYNGTAGTATLAPLIDAGFFIAAPGVNCVKFFSSGNAATLLNNRFSSTVAAVAGLSSINNVVALNNVNASSGAILDDNASVSTVQIDALTQILRRYTGWVAVSSFANSWVNFGGYSAAGYLLDMNGFVHLRGLLKSGTNGTTAFTLPAGYRPAYPLFIPNTSSATASYIIIGIDGTVTCTGSTTAFALDGVSFSVE